MTKQSSNIYASMYKHSLDNIFKLPIEFTYGKAV